MRELIQRAIEESGGLSVVAAKLNEASPTVANWLARGVPVLRCAAFEQAVGGRVMRWTLRPNDWHVIWPELRGAEGAPDIAAEQGA